MKLRDRWMLVAFALLYLYPFVWAAVTWDEFWQSIAPYSTLLALVFLIALVQRRRWAWWLLIAFEVVLLVSYAWDPAGAVVFVSSLARLALLLSPSMRRYLADRPKNGPVGVDGTRGWSR